MQGMRSAVARSLLPKGREAVLAGWRMSGWAAFFDSTVGRRHPDVTRPIAPWMPALAGFEDRHGAARLTLSSTGMLIGIARRRCLYLPLGDLSHRALVQGHATWRALGEDDDPALRQLVEYDFTLRAKGPLHAEATRLMPLETAARPAARDHVLDVLQRFADRGPLPKTLRARALTALGLPHGHRPCLHRRAKELLARDWTLCQAHGDLTPANLMQLNGEPRLIDLDRYQTQCPAIFDPLHYAVETQAKDAGLSWLDVVDDPFRVDTLRVSPTAEPDAAWTDIIHLYIILRIALEYRTGGRVSSRWRLRVGQLLDRIEASLAGDRRR